MFMNKHKTQDGFIGSVTFDYVGATVLTIFIVAVFLVVLALFLYNVGCLIDARCKRKEQIAERGKPLESTQSECERRGALLFARGLLTLVTGWVAFLSVMALINYY